MIRHLSKRERAILLMTFGVVLVASGDRFILRPALGFFKSHLEELESTEAKLARNYALLAGQETVAGEYGRYAEVFGLIRTPEAETQETLKAVEQLGQGAQVKILDMKPLPVREGDFSNVFSLQLECEGSLEAIARFLLNIGESREGLRVEKMRLAAPRSGDKSLRANMQVSTIRMVVKEP
ncbi:MAG: type 4a pilus biogenesis protein PilO [Candidatus Omnitrophica bacterium]|nr:type 4a pilus biogenesis protein PilO [Candidatus Omnitrophota bacterium]